MSLLLPSFTSTSTTSPRYSYVSNNFDSIIAPHLHVYDETDNEVIKAVNPQSLNDISFLMFYPANALFTINSKYAGKFHKTIIRHTWIKECFHYRTKGGGMIRCSC